MREAIAKMIGEARGKNLRLGLEPAESAGMDDAIAIAREVGAIRVRCFRVAPAPRMAQVHCERSELHCCQFSVSACAGKERASLTGAMLMTCPAAAPVPGPLHLR